MESTQQLKKMVYAALMAALTAAGAYIAVPIGPVPIVMQNLFVLLAGLLLGGHWGLISIGVYLLAGAVGLPVFAGGTGGIGKFVGPTGGYLLGFAAAAYLVGMLSHVGKGRVFVDVLAMLAGTLSIYVFGVSWLKAVTGMSMTNAVAVGMLPFPARRPPENSRSRSHCQGSAPDDGGHVRTGAGSRIGVYVHRASASASFPGI
jgi:biotin transport system substrate-specific component